MHESRAGRRRNSERRANEKPHADVEIGNRWYFYLCDQRGLEPVATYDALTVQYKAPVLKGPFNVEARRQAGFTEAELARLAHA